MTAKLHIFKAGLDWLGFFYALFAIKMGFYGPSTTKQQKK
jgi:hypothetical protein